MSTIIEQVDETPTAEADRPPHWLVELNFAGCRISRWAEKRRHLLALNPRSFAS